MTDRPADALLIRHVRLVPVGGRQAPDAPVDLRIVAGRVSEVGPGLSPAPGEDVLEADGRHAIPGLWDKHVHLVQWAVARTRLDTSGTTCAEDVVARVAAHLDTATSPGPVVGLGHRSATWPRPPTVAELDAVAGSRAVVLISGDGHSGWLSTAAFDLLGSAAATGPLEEGDWFPLYGRLAELPSTRAAEGEGYARAVADASSKGVVGIVDLEFGTDFVNWPARWERGITGVRVRAATYPEGLDLVQERGLRTGDPLVPGQDLVVMGPLKVISDGSLNTRTAYCCTPYADSASLTGGRGRANYGVEELTALLTRGRELGLDATVHAIGDAALSAALEAYEGSGARGSIEHAQLVGWDDVDRMARLGLTASVQPAHLLDDRDVTEQCWPDRSDRVYAFRSMLDRGVTLALGSDAPVSPLDPWLAMAAAVHRSADDRPPWHPEQALTVAEALAASTDGQATLAPGSPGDVVLLDADPLAAQPGSLESSQHLKGMPVAATLVAGRVTHLSL